MKSCPKCKTDNNDGAGSCCKCGAELGAPVKANLTPEQHVPKSENESFSGRTKRLCWFAVWGGVALAIFAINPAYFRAAFLFPIGLFAFFANGTQSAFWAWGTGGFLLGWVLYAVLSAMMFGAKNKHVFFAIYVIFCPLLALNVGGCQHVVVDTSHIQ